MTILFHRMVPRPVRRHSGWPCCAMQVRYCWIAMVPQVYSRYGAARALQSRMSVSREAFVALAGEPDGVTAP